MMFVSFNKVFNPTLEEKKKQIELLNKCLQTDLDEQGAGCSNCKHRKYVQQNQFYDYTTCKFDKTVELAFGRNTERHCCDKYEFVGFFGGGRMRAVMISIHPKWCELIANGKKTVEVRKTRPKLETPFKVYIYCTKDKKFSFCTDNGEQYTHIGNGKVIGEFVCDYIDELHEYELTPQGKFYLHEKARLDLFLEQSCLSYGKICDYRKNLPCHKPLYAWKISNLVIYDKPKELWEFMNYNKQKICLERNCFSGDCYICPNNSIITRPPQSWCYVEEVDND